MKTNQNVKLLKLSTICITAGIFAPSSQAAVAYTPPSSGLVSWWRAEDNVTDSAGANNGSTVGTVNFVTGYSGLGFGFNGSSYVTIPDSPSLGFSNSVTVGLWYKSDLANNDYYGLLDKRVGATSANYGLNFAPSTGIGPYYDDPSVQDGDDFDSYFEASRYTPAPGPGAFHHLAATFSQIAANTVQLETYIDGQLVRTKQISGNLANTLNSAPITIGATAQGSGEFFAGVIDEVVIYNRVLSGNEIQVLAVVPEPSSAVLGLCALGLLLNRKQRR
jgi:hypothetical protein